MRLRRGRSTLSYEVPRPEGAAAAMAEFAAALSSRQSVGEWRRRCDASLRASRRRRGLRADGVLFVVHGPERR